MASTIRLQDAIDFTIPFMRNLPLINATNNQPAVMNANIVLQTILGPPFCWRWNRATTTFTTANGTQDYNKSSFTDFGFLEKAAVTDAVGPNSTEILLMSPLGLATEKDRPRNISTQSDDNAGTVTFRLLPVPDAVYTVTLTYQKKAVLFNPALLTGTFAPIPDEFAYIYLHGFAALSLLYADDQRFVFHNQKFVSGLLGASEGLTEMQKNIFANNWFSYTDQQNSSNFRTQQGVQARGV